MRNTMQLFRRAAIAGALVMPLLATPALAGADYVIDWYAIHAGGVSHATTGAYRLSGTIGQPVPGFSEGGDYALNAGFWVAAPLLSDLIFHSGFEGE